MSYKVHLLKVMLLQRNEPRIALLMRWLMHINALNVHKNGALSLPQKCDDDIQLHYNCDEHCKKLQWSSR